MHGIEIKPLTNLDKNMHDMKINTLIKIYENKVKALYEF